MTLEVVMCQKPGYDIIFIVKVFHERTQTPLMQQCWLNIEYKTLFKRLICHKVLFFLSFGSSTMDTERQ